MAELTLQQRRQIDRLKEGLVTAAEGLLEEARVWEKSDFGHSQLRNLLAVAAETESPAVVVNFIRYQMGRDVRGKNWRSERGGKSLGKRFIEALQGGKGAVMGALNRIPGLDGEARQLAHIELVRIFVGFAIRSMKFLELRRSKEKKGGSR